MWFWRRFFSFSVLTVSFGLGLGLGLEPLWTRTWLGLEPLWTWTWLGLELEPLWTWTCLGLDKGGLNYSPRSTIRHALFLCGMIWGAGFRCLGLLLLSSPGDMNMAGKEFLECSCLLSWFLKSLDNRIHSIAEEARGRKGSIHMKVFILPFNIAQIYP